MVYFITDGEFIKIGTAKDPESRLKELQTGNPRKLSIIKVIHGSFAIEKAFHKTYREYMVSGEWFKFPDNVLNDLLNEDVDLSNYKYDGKFCNKEYVPNIIDKAIIERVFKSVANGKRVSINAISKELDINKRVLQEVAQDLGINNYIESYNNAIKRNGGLWKPKKKNGKRVVTNKKSKKLRQDMTQSRKEQEFYLNKY